MSESVLPEQAFVHPPPVDERIARVAGRQHGVVSRRQLEALGLSAGALEWRVAHGRLHRIHRGVYAVGHRATSRHGRWLAAVLAAGDGAVLSHRSAAALWGIRATSQRDVEITAAGQRAALPGIRAHRTRLLDARHFTVREGIPTTTVARTLLDLAEVLPAARVERAVEQAQALRLCDEMSLGDVADAAPGRRGARVLRAIAQAGEVGTTPTRSRLEERFVAIVDGAGLPRPRMNATVRTAQRLLEVDALWPEQRVVAELDGHRHHGTRAAFERDRARDAELVVAGYRVVRFTWRQATGDPAGVGATLAALLDPLAVGARL